MGLTVEFDLLGADEAAADYDAIGYRAQHPKPAFDHITNLLVQSETRLFARQPMVPAGGKVPAHKRYDLTGRLKASLTQADGLDAIRHAHDDELLFGTSVFYARFQKRRGKSTVLKLQATTRKQAAKTLLDHITGNPSV